MASHAHPRLVPVFVRSPARPGIRLQQGSARYAQHLAQHPTRLQTSTFEGAHNGSYARLGLSRSFLNGGSG